MSTAAAPASLDDTSVRFAGASGPPPALDAVKAKAYGTDDPDMLRRLAARARAELARDRVACERAVAHERRLAMLAVQRCHEAEEEAAVKAVELAARAAEAAGVDASGARESLAGVAGAAAALHSGAASGRAHTERVRACVESAASLRCAAQLEAWRNAREKQRRAARLADMSDWTPRESSRQAGSAAEAARSAAEGGRPGAAALLRAAAAPLSGSGGRPESMQAAREARAAEAAALRSRLRALQAAEERAKAGQAAAERLLVRGREAFRGLQAEMAHVVQSVRAKEEARLRRRRRLEDEVASLSRIAGGAEPEAVAARAAETLLSQRISAVRSEEERRWRSEMDAAASARAARINEAQSRAGAAMRGWVDGLATETGRLVVRSVMGRVVETHKARVRLAVSAAGLEACVAAARPFVDAEGSTAAMPPPRDDVARLEAVAESRVPGAGVLAHDPEQAADGVKDVLPSRRANAAALGDDDKPLEDRPAPLLSLPEAWDTEAEPDLLLPVPNAVCKLLRASADADVLPGITSGSLVRLEGDALPFSLLRRDVWRAIAACGAVLSRLDRSASTFRAQLDARAPFHIEVPTTSAESKAEAEARQERAAEAAEASRRLGEAAAHAEQRVEQAGVLARLHAARSMARAEEQQRRASQAVTQQTQEQRPAPSHAAPSSPGRDAEWLDAKRSPAQASAAASRLAAEAAVPHYMRSTLSRASAARAPPAAQAGRSGPAARSSPASRSPPSRSPAPRGGRASPVPRPRQRSAVELLGDSSAPPRGRPAPALAQAPSPVRTARRQVPDAQSPLSTRAPRASLFGSRASASRRVAAEVASLVSPVTTHRRPRAGGDPSRIGVGPAAARLAQGMGAAGSPRASLSTDRRGNVRVARDALHRTAAAISRA